MLSLGVSHTAMAQKVTPTEVFQVVETISSELDEFHAANFTQAPRAEIKLSPRLPRHVLQKARTVYQKIQMLRDINGLLPKAVAEIPVREVTPGDVKKSVDIILAELREIREIYHLDDETQLVALSSAKTPTDVYRELTQIAKSIDALGIPAVVPNDVYQVAQTVIGDLEKIYTHLEKDLTVITDIEKSSGKKPADAYNASFVLLEKLQAFNEQGEYDIKGGVVLPVKKAANLTPTDVMDLLNNALAEIGALKFKMGMSNETELAALEGGKTPSDVFDLVIKAQKLVDELGD